MTSNGTTTPDAVDPRSMAGHLLRRTHQVHHQIWSETVGEVLTPQQYSALTVIAASGGQGTDQSTVGLQAGLDRSTAAGVVQRLLRDHWILAEPDPQDGRRRRLRTTAPARSALQALSVPVAQVQDRLLAPLDPADRAPLTEALRSLAELPPDQLTEAGPRPGHLVRRAQQRHTQLWIEELGQVLRAGASAPAATLTGPQFAVLAGLLHRGPQIQGELAAAAGLDRSNASDVLRRLEGRGLLVRRPVPGDARSRQVQLTDQGIQAVRLTLPAAVRVQERLLEPVPRARRKRLRHWLAALAHTPENMTHATDRDQGWIG